MNQHGIVLYQMEDTNVCVSVYYENETFWLTTKAMAELFGVKTQAVTKHLGNIYEEELFREETVPKRNKFKSRESAKSDALLISIISARHRRVEADSETSSRFTPSRVYCHPLTIKWFEVQKRPYRCFTAA